MKNIILTVIIFLLLPTTIIAQDSIQIHKKNGEINSFAMDLVDSLTANTTSQSLYLSYPLSEIKEFSFPFIIHENELNLNQNDNKTYFNQLKSVSFKTGINSKIYKTTTAFFKNGDSDTLIIPYLTDFSNLIATYETTGSYILVNGEIQKNSISSNDYSQTVEFKVFSFSGDVHTYHLTLINSGLSIFSITTSNSEITTDWNKNCEFRLMNSNGLEIHNSNIEIKGRGSHYNAKLKSSYGLKLDNKVQLLNMPKGKRWILSANNFDKSLLRTSLGYILYSKYLSTCWTPEGKPIELLINNRHLGSYFLYEQPRITEERISSGLLLSIDQNIEDGDDYFISKKTNQIFIFKDPEVGSTGTGLIRSQDLINKFESVLFSNNFLNATNGYKNFIDINSFADWYIINELARNIDAPNSNCYINITDNKIIRMGPICDLNKYFGNIAGSDINENPEGFVVKNTIWMDRLFEDPTFKTLVYERFQKLYKAKTDILKEIDNLAETLKYSATGDENTYNNYGLATENINAITANYKIEITNLKTWIIQRLDWLNESLKQ